MSVTLVITNDPITSPMYCAENTTLYLSRRLVLRVMTTNLKKTTISKTQSVLDILYILTDRSFDKYIDWTYA